MLLAEDGLLMHFRLVHAAGFIGHHHMIPKPGAGVLGAHTPVRDEQLADLLVHGQQLYISSGPLFCGQPPVVHGGHGAGTVNILEIHAIELDDRTGHRGNGGAVGVMIGLEIVTCLDCHRKTSVYFHIHSNYARFQNQIQVGNITEFLGIKFVKSNGGVGIIHNS